MVWLLGTYFFEILSLSGILRILTSRWLIIYPKLSNYEHWVHNWNAQKKIYWKEDGVATWHAINSPEKVHNNKVWHRGKIIFYLC